MTEKRFRFRVKIEGKEAGVVSAIAPPIDVPGTFGTRGRVPVKGTINGFPFRSSLMSMGGCHMMPVNKALCQGAGAKPGDMVEVVMERDAEERTVEPPIELASVKEKQAGAGEVGRTLVHTQAGDGELDQRGEAGRNEGATTGESHFCPRERCEVGSREKGNG